MTYILFDIGGTKTRVAKSDNLESYDEPIKFETLHDFSAGIEKFTDVVREVSAGQKIQGMAGGIRGILNREKTMMVNDPGKVLLNWAGRHLVSELEKTFHTQVYLENDTAIVGLGEAVFGAGKGYPIVAYHTVSTGVGGARIVDQHVDSAHAGFEPGHQVLDLDRTVLGSAISPTLENLVSGSALETRRGVKPYEIAQDDSVWDDLARYLAYGLKNTLVYWSPDIIVLGGSMIVGDPRIFNEDIVRHTKEVAKDLPVPPIVDAELEDEGGLYGAMALLRQKVS